ncbi:hypothetical protein BDL97_05G065500 [Sphagnum fallax]|nr:hypothetical protein BDL97_05G065500 [Sphagnum fallax]
MSLVSDIKLIRTDTTLDLSQKAEKATKIYFTNCSAKLMCSQIAHQRTYQVEHIKPNQIIATLVIDFDLLDFRLPRLLSTFPSYSNSFNSCFQCLFRPSTI